MASSETSSSLRSHKRTSSAAGNTQPPESKRHAQDLSKPPTTQFVYILMETTRPMYGDDMSTIRGVYATIKDANNALIGIVYDEYDQAEDCSRGTEGDGRVWWSSGDVGEGDQVKLCVEVEEVKPSGSEEDREWLDDGAQEEDDEEEDEEEEEVDEDDE